MNNLHCILFSTLVLSVCLCVTSVRGIFIIIQMPAGFGQIYRCPPLLTLLKRRTPMGGARPGSTHQVYRYPNSAKIFVIFKAKIFEKNMCTEYRRANKNTSVETYKMGPCLIYRTVPL